MSHEPIEGVDYIFDRYLFLNNILLESMRIKPDQAEKLPGLSVVVNTEGLTEPQYSFVWAATGEPASDIQARLLQPDSSDEDVAAAIKTARVLYHPDRFTTAPQSLKANIDSTRNKIDRAADILGNPALRPLYNERLLGFYRESPMLVSHDGHAIIELGKSGFSIDALLRDPTDTSDLELKVAQMTQFDAAKFASMKQLHDLQPDNAVVGELYRDALTLKFIYLDIMETVAWSKLGFREKQNLDSVPQSHALHADSYVDAVQAELNHVKETVLPEALAVRNDALRIGTATPLLLLSDPNDAAQGSQPSSLPTTLTQEQMARILKTAKDNIDARAQYVTGIAAQKQAVLSELCTLSRIQTLKPIDHNDPTHTLMTILPSDNHSDVIVLAMRINAKTGSSQTLETGLEGTTLDDKAREALGGMDNLHLVYVNKELAGKYMLTESLMLAQRLHDAWIDAHTPKPRPGAGPAAPSPL